MTVDSLCSLMSKLLSWKDNRPRIRDENSNCLKIVEWRPGSCNKRQHKYDKRFGSQNLKNKKKTDLC